MIDRFVQLKSYDSANVSDQHLEVEDENNRESDSANERSQLRCFANSAKRGVLFRSQGSA